MLDPKDWGIEHWSAAAVLSLLGSVLGIQKAVNLFKRGRVDEVRADAEHALIDGLREDLERLRVDLDEERRQRQQMDLIIHQQSIRLTKTQTALLRLIDLLKQKRVTIPDDLQVDIGQLFQRETKHG